MWNEFGNTDITFTVGYYPLVCLSVVIVCHHTDAW